MKRTLGGWLSITTLLAMGVTQSQAGQKIWADNASHTSFLTASYWSGGTLPATTDYATFDSSTPSRSTTIGISMASGNSGSGSEILTSLQLTGGRALTLGNSSTTVSGTLTLNGESGVALQNTSTYLLTIQDTSGSGNKTMNVVFGNSGLSVDITSSGGITISSVISGDNGFTKTGAGAGALTLSGANTYSGDTTLAGLGAIALANSDALGTGTINLKSTQASTGVTLGLSGGITVTNPITMDSTTGRENIIGTGTGNNALTGGLTITGAGGNALVIANNQTSGNFTFSGGVNGATYPGSVSLRGNQAGAVGFFNGVVTIASDLQNNGTTDWTINSVGSSYNSTRFLSTGNIILGNHNALAANAQVYWGGTAPATWGKLDMAGYDASVAGLNSTGATLSGTYGGITNSSATSDSTLTLANLLANLTFAGTISDGVAHKISLVMNSAGRIQTLTGANTYSGDTTISAGKLVLSGSGSISNSANIAVAAGATCDVSAVTFTVGSAQTLKGTGTVIGNVTVAGTLAPGTDASNTGTLTNINNVTFNSGATYHVDVSGANSDLLLSSGDIALGSGTATLTLNGTLSAASYVILRTSGTLSGTFKDLADGTEIGTTGYYIHYVTSGSPDYIVLNQSKTPVVLLQLQALTVGGKVTVRWSTSSESETAGFDLYRVVNGESVKLNDALIAAKGWPNGGIGASYSVADAGAQPGQTYTYKLVERTTDGQSIDYGPYDRTVSEFVMKPLEVTAAGAKVRWLSRAGEIYRVLKSTDLTSGQYQPIAENIAATPPENEYLDAAPGNSGFYRIELQP